MHAEMWGLTDQFRSVQAGGHTIPVQSSAIHLESTAPPNIVERAVLGCCPRVAVCPISGGEGWNSEARARAGRPAAGRAGAHAAARVATTCQRSIGYY